MQFLDLAATSAAVSAVSGRKAKIELLAGALRRLDPAEIAAGSSGDRSPMAGPSGGDLPTGG